MEKLSRAQGADIVHNLIMENRAHLNVSGVEDVESFNDEEIILHTKMEVLIVTGSELKINKLSVDAGEVEIEGYIDCLRYAAPRASAGGFLSRIFK
ncbi:sporulation protein YabP [Qingrenia yutianensis]|uniref:Sporulation protein YabP n=1 Tax=Qingrenia yutianensis TaxID=2763676 RepID=A0A926FB97_9FIRM|nr:sporulation protein YabP [Qingrenia yutianensis]MBC8595324.1 sporulation protein YabP [Qingrenia yutianensis]UKI38122.1 MAG: sporulation protein YabP [Clostridiales bacterium]